MFGLTLHDFALSMFRLLEMVKGPNVGTSEGYVTLTKSPVRGITPSVSGANL